MQRAEIKKLSSLERDRLAMATMRRIEREDTPLARTAGASHGVFSTEQSTQQPVPPSGLLCDERGKGMRRY